MFKGLGLVVLVENVWLTLSGIKKLQNIQESSHLGPHIPVDVVEPQNVHADGHFHYGFDVGEEQG